MSPDSTAPPVEPSGGEDSDCGVRNISACVAEAIDGFFQRLVESALNPLLDLLSQTLLTTPEPGDLPRVGELWDSSWQLMLAIYGLLVMAAGVLLMVRETLQTRYSVQDLAPRIVVGFLAGAMSLLIATQAIRFANALATAVAGDGLDPGSAGAALRELATITAARGLVSPAAGAGIFVILLEVALVVLLVILLITYVIRVAITIILVVAAPLALMCHVLPGLDAVARWWWRSFAACLAIQVVQSLVLVTALRVFLTPGGWEFFGPNADGLVSLIIGLALMAVLIKVPFWLLSSMRIGTGGGRSMIGSLARGYVAYKTFGMLKGGEKAVASAVRRPTSTAAAPGHTVRPVQARPRRSRPPAVPAAGSDPYARTRATRDGQLILPLEGVRRVRPTPAASTPPQPAGATSSTRTAPSGVTPAATTTGRKPSRGRQLAFDFTPPDPYKGIRANHRGQYPLPIPVTRVRPGSPSVPAKRPAPGPATRPTPPPASPPRTRRGTQLAFEFDPPDPYEGNRPLRSGQYRLPLPVPRVRPTERTNPPPPPVASVPPSPPSGRQLHLPLPDLPVRRRARRSPRGGNTR
ncbi:conjugal transfer protein TrbL family protein [Nocardia carnea]|uniref:conjugal transfer protein TrbL family protein n=1 Tax=Nocardia carnea TaxID=37328 RepID=UPI0024575222|nr:conjugal transfer protein TrbL family protein [Nocardia carnea]